MRTRIYLVNFAWFHLPLLLVGRLLNWEIHVFDVDLTIRRRALSRYLLDLGWLNRIVAQHYAFGLSHTRALESAERIVDGMANKSVITSMSRLYGDDEVVLVFKKELADRLVVLTSIQEYLFRQHGSSLSSSQGMWLLLGDQLESFKLLKKHGEEILFPDVVKIVKPISSFLAQKNIFSAIKLAMIFLAYFLHLAAQSVRKSNQVRKKMKYAVSLSNPLFEKFKGPREFTFIVDDVLIKREEVAFLVEYPRVNSFFESYQKNGYHLFAASTTKTIKQLFECSTLVPLTEFLNVLPLLYRSWKYSYIREAVNCLLLTRLHWARVTAKVTFENYIYCNKEGKHQIAANIFFRNLGISTWNYSQFVGGPYQVDNSATSFDGRHVLWSFMNCEYFLVNNDAMLQSMKKQHQHVCNYKVIGNIFAEMIKELGHEKERIESPVLREVLHRQEYGQVVAVFDTSYVDIADTGMYSSYEEAEAFLSDVIRLAEANVKKLFLFKPSKDDNWFVDKAFVWSSPEKGEKVVKLREFFSKLSNTLLLNDSVDPVEVIAISDVVITNCFSSPTADALSTGKPAFWYKSRDDVHGYPLDKINGLVAHGYSELQERLDRAFESEYVKALYAQPLFQGMVNSSPDICALTCFRNELISRGSGQDIESVLSETACTVNKIEMSI